MSNGIERRDFIKQSLGAGVTAVAASELLARTEQAEMDRVRRVQGPVIYRKLQAHRRTTAREAGLSITWEIWNDASNQRVRQRVENSTGAPSVLVELEKIFRSNRMDAQRPLSAGVYQAWRQSIRPRSEEVSEMKLPDGAGALTLTTKVAGPVAVNAIIEAELVVRAEDWHPVKQSLHVQGEQEVRHYELIETAFEVLALNALSPSIFADSAAPGAKGVDATPLVSAPALPTPTAASAAELMAAEIEAHYALHHARACLEPFEVARGASGHVEVRGVVETKRRKDELLAALNANPLVTPKIQTVEEAAANARPRRNRRQVRDLSSEPGGAQIKAGRLPIQTYLERHLGAGPDGSQPINVARQIAELSNASISLSEAALSEAWALRRLAEWYGSRGPGELPASSQRLLEGMARDHGARLKAHARGLRLRLEPVFSSLADQREGASAPGQQNPQGAGWPAQSLISFSAVEQIDRLTSGLFAGTGLPAGDSGETAARDLLAALRRLENRLESLLSAVSKYSVNEVFFVFTQPLPR